MQVHWGQVCVTSYPYCPRWTTDRQTGRSIKAYTHTRKHALIHTQALFHTYQSVINIQACLWHWKQGHGLETLTQHATSNPKQTRDLDGEGGGESESEKEKADWLGICLKEKVRATRCLSNCRAIQRGEKKKGSEEKKSRQAYRAALTDQHWLKDMWKGSSQNTALPSWTFYSAENCSWCKRQSKRNMPVNNLSVFRQTTGLKHTAICVTASLNSQKFTFTI